MAPHPISRCHYCDARLPLGVHERFCSESCARDYKALAATDKALREEAQLLTATIDAIWERCAQDVRWADTRRKCGDLHRYRTGLQGAWLRAERSFARLAEPANNNGHRPELKILAGEHPAFVDPADTEVA